MNAVVPEDGMAILERVIVQGDLSKLTPAERVTYYKRVCESASLNPLTKPLEFITLNGKLVLYALRGATDQLRKVHKVSIAITSREKVDDIYTVTAQAKMPDGRTDESMGAVNLKGLSGDALANQFLKCETKAKRRVTLSICGLGLLDETEVETIPDARIHPNAGAGEGMTNKAKQRVADICIASKDLLAQGNEWGAYENLEGANFDMEEKLYAWTMFDSKERSALTRMKNAEKAQKPAEI